MCIRDRIASGCIVGRFQLDLKRDAIRVGLRRGPRQGPDKSMDRIRAFFIVPFKLQLLPIKGVAPLRHTPGKGNEHIALPTLFVRAACIAPDLSLIHI